MKLTPAALASLALPLVSLAAACSTPCPDAAPQVTQQRFACADGSRLLVTFDRASGKALVSEDGGAPLTLAIQIAGVGYHYEGDGADLRSGRDPGMAIWRPPASETVALEEEDQPKGAPVSCNLVT